MHPLTDTIWPGVLLWVALYISDYWCTLTCARMYRGGVQHVVAFEGSYELTPYYQKDVDALRWMSPRFVVALVASVGVLVAPWSVSRQEAASAYAFGLGALVLVEAAVHVRHVRNLYIFKRILAHDVSAAESSTLARSHSDCRASSSWDSRSLTWPPGSPSPTRSWREESSGVSRWARSTCCALAGGRVRQESPRSDVVSTPSQPLEAQRTKGLNECARTSLASCSSPRLP